LKLKISPNLIFDGFNLALFLLLLRLTFWECCRQPLTFHKVRENPSQVSKLTFLRALGLREYIMENEK